MGRENDTSMRHVFQYCVDKQLKITTMWLNSTTIPNAGLPQNRPGSGQTNQTIQGVNWLATGRWRGWLLVLGLCLSLTQSWGQGYIYVHKKTLSEESSLNFNFTGTGSIGTFTLNDLPVSIQTEDVGSAANGRLWAIATPAGGGAIYYRDVNSSSWVQTPTFGATAIDGDVGNGNVHINSSGTVYRFTSPSTVDLIGSPGNFGGQIAVDVTSSQQGTIVISTLNATIWKWVSGTTWTQLSGINGFRVDASPVNGDLVYGSGNGVYRSNSSGGAVTALGNPTGAAVQPSDVAYDANGNIYALVNSYVYRWVSGTTWVQEPTSAGLFKLTGGVNGELWGLYNGVKTITSRTSDGTWIDDERVRIGTNDNSQLIPVTAGTYTITETVPSGWSLQDITIYDPTNNSTSSVVGASATLNVANGEVVHVVFQNGLIQTFAITNNCSTAYTENFGTGASGTLGPALTGQTSYHYVGAGYVTDGYYAVVSQAGDIGSYAINMFDHTTGNGTGRMMAVNAAFDRGEFFRRRFTNLVVGATYNFSAWVASVNNGGIQPNVQFEVRDATTGALLNSSTSGNIFPAGVWKQGQLLFQATSTQIDLVLRNNNDGGSGNDLVLDDITFSLAKDLGDAPDSYGTSLGTNGPCHGVITGLQIGSLIDSESDAFPASAGANAIGDDSNNTDDEDGVSLLPLCTGNSSYSAVVTVTNTAAPSARLIAWVDFNKSGTFEASEGVSIPAGSSGTYTLTWSSLSGLTTGTTYARVRLTSDAAITTNTPGGSANDGEVEDYQLTIVSGGGTVTASTNSLTICSGDLVSINYTTAPTVGQTVRWNRMPGNVSGFGAVSEALSATGTTPTSYTYTTVIADVFGCPSTPAITVVTVNPRPIITPSVCSQTICLGETGAITFVSSVSATINWLRVEDGATGTGDISQLFNSAGNFTYKIWGVSAAPASCPTSTTITCVIVVNECTPCSLTVLAGTPACDLGNATYTVSVTATDATSLNASSGNVSGTAPFFTISGILAGVDVILTPVGSCTNVTPLTVEAPNCCALPVPTASVTTQPTCTVPTGTITVSAPLTGVTYSFDGGLTFQVSNVKSGLLANTNYAVVIKDNTSGCLSEQLLLSVNSAGNLRATASSNSPVCTGNLLQLYATSAGSTGAVTYNWSGPDGFTSTLQNPSILSPTAASGGVYTVTVSDPTCSTTASTTVTIATQPSLTISGAPSLTICSGTATVLNVTGDGGATVTWTNTLGESGTGTSINFAGVSNVSGQPQTVMYFIKANAGGCSDETTVEVTINPAPALQVNPRQAVICALEQARIVATPFPVTATVDWTRTPAVPSPASGTGMGILTVNETLPAGSYTYSFTATQDGCTSAPVTVPLTVNN